MTVKFGFYDSLNSDRLYNANDINTFFEGVFSDGVFEFVGDALNVTNSPGTMNILIGTGRAWFNNLWLRNTSTLTLAISPSSLIHPRKDLVILEFDSSITVRENSIKVLTGIPSATPIPPILANTSTLHQYALAEIYVDTAVSEIEDVDITNKIGTVGTPYTVSLLSEPSSGFTTYNISPTTSNIIASLWGRYNANLSGLTGDRDFILPTPSAIGDEIELFITVGDPDYEFVVKINGVEWSRLFIENEVVKFISTGTGVADWIISQDGRISSSCKIYSAAAQAIPHATIPATKITFDTAGDNPHGMADLTNDVIKIRRNGRYAVAANVQLDAGVIYSRFLGNILKNVYETELARNETSTASTASYPNIPFASQVSPLSHGDTLELDVYQVNGSGLWKGTIGGVSQLTAHEII